MAFSSADAIADRLGLQAIADGARLLPPSWNVAPTNQIRIIVPADSNGRGFEMPLSGSSTDGNALRGSSTDGLALEVARWGLQPPWSKKGSGLINSRIETAVEKPVFASAFAKRRCIVPVDGYYEWQKLPDGKQPWFISGPNQMLYFAGIYNIGQNEKNVAILTMPTAPDIADIHHRMPVSFQPDDFPDG